MEGAADLFCVILRKCDDYVRNFGSLFLGQIVRNSNQLHNDVRPNWNSHDWAMAAKARGAPFTRRSDSAPRQPRLIIASMFPKCDTLPPNPRLTNGQEQDDQGAR